jgi:multiple sugar transport system substrate-binding protein
MGCRMARIKLRGMTWDHRRAIDPLTETMPPFRGRNPDVEIEWSSRPLNGFEFTPVDVLAKEFDFIILDHPFSGLIAATGCLVPLDTIASQGEDPFVGPSLDSYRLDGKLWALPVDAACQVAVSRPDLMRALDTPPRAIGENSPRSAKRRGTRAFGSPSDYRACTA